jgi:hypothetical protein
MRQALLNCVAASAIIAISSAAHAQSAAPVSRQLRAQALASPKLAVVVPRVEQAADQVQIVPMVAAPSLPKTLVVQSANPLTSIQALPVERELSLSEMRSTRALKLGSSTIDLSAMLANKDALPNIARRLEASPGAVTVKATDVNAYVVPQGLIVRSFLNYRIKPGACSDSSRRSQIEQAGVSCAERLSESQKVADYANPNSARYVEDPAQRDAAIAKAREDWAKQDAETAAQVANFRAILANPAEREKIAADIGAAETTRLESLNDDALAGELISSAETKIEDVMFIPKEDEVDKGSRAMVADYRRLGVEAAALNLPVVENQPISKVVFLTGFTLGRQYEWSKRIEKTINWCWVGCSVTYYAGARAGFSYGFGLRFPIVLDGTYRTVSESSGEKGYLIASMNPVDGTPAQYAASGLASTQIFNGQEFVAELKASAGYDYKLPLMGEGHKTLTVGYDLADKLPAPYTHGQFTPPAPGTSSGEIPFVFDQIDLLMGYGNWGAAGILVHPAVKVGLHSDALRMTVHDNVSGTDQLIVNGKKLPLAINPTDHKSSFWIGQPVYNIGFIVTPGVNAHAFIDVGVWSDSWDFPVWFPDVAITLPPGGVDFACHSGTVCRRDYAYTGSSRPGLIDTAAATGTLEVMDSATATPKPPSPAVEGALGTLRQRRGAIQALGTVAAVSVCPEGLVERLANAGDHKCVSADEGKRIADENRLDASNHDPSGAYGPDTCLSGLVWRDAVPGDHVCVSPQRRDEISRLNAEVR